MAFTDAERQKMYRERHPEKFFVDCECGNKKHITSLLCRQCDFKKNRTGKNSKFWKGGYERHLWHNRKRYASKRAAVGSHTFDEWEELKYRNLNMCVCCKREEGEIVLTEDHIIPLSKGGSDFIENIQPLCKECNSIKYNRIISLTELAELITSVEK